MAHDGGGSPHDLVVQTWIMYSFAMLLFILRLYARYTRMGLKWQLEDFLMVLAVAWYTTFAVTNIAIIEGGGSSLYLPGEFATFTPEDILQRIKGSKIEFASEMCMLNTMYTLKACMILIYFQLTSNAKQQTMVKLCAAYTFCGWLATVLVLFFNCHPFSGYWTLPPPQEECATYFRYEITQCVFNVTSDLAMLSVILPMLFRLRMPWKTKVPLIFIFSMGLLVVICASTSKYFTFRDIWDDSYQFWYLREASIAMYVTNLPYVWSLARSTFRVLRSDGVNTDDKYGSGPIARSKPSSGSRNRVYSLRAAKEGAPFPARPESEENIINLKELATVTMGSDPEYKGNYIQKTTDVTVEVGEP